MSEKWIEKENYRKKVIFTGEDLASDGVRIQLVEVDEDNTVSPHYHKSQTEVYNVQSGKSILTIGDEDHKAGHGDTFICKPDTVHAVENKFDKTFRLLVVKTNYKDNDSFWL